MRFLTCGNASAALLLSLLVLTCLLYLFFASVSTQGICMLAYMPKGGCRIVFEGRGRGLQLYLFRLSGMVIAIHLLTPDSTPPSLAPVPYSTEGGIERSFSLRVCGCDI
eukprot:GILK01015089.1.p2 GENE.GILK01015089.1~~GILK01015089.1.p2  ORF type:complete len:109 (-),score=0.76 GILK01015089.1:19-345(-)